MSESKPLGFIPLEPRQIEQNFCDLHPAFSLAEARVEADRCLYCYDAPCTRACPTHIDVPAFIKKISTDNLTGSARVIFDANPIGATCARVCPTEALCEGACVEKTLLKKPIEIGRLQRHATDFAVDRNLKLFVPGPPTGKSIGVLGAGPAGYSCAVYLARLGHSVTIYDRRPLPGGLNTYGMAEYKMTQKVSLEETDLARGLGIRFEMNHEVTPGRLGELESQHDAIFLGVGLGATSRLGIPGEDLPGVLDALQFIERVKTREWDKVPLGRTVAVIGAGNTAVDAATQAKRLGAETVYMVYRRGAADMPAYPYEFELAKADGIEFKWFTAPAGILHTPDGGVAALRCLQTQPGEPDERGRRTVTVVPGSEYLLQCDLVIKALGQSKMSQFLSGIPGLLVDGSGRVQVDPATMATGNPRYFAGGDCVNGGREAVDAAQMGKLAAMGIHESLTGQKVELSGAKLPEVEPRTRAGHGPVDVATAHPEIPAAALGVKAYAAEG